MLRKYASSCITDMMLDQKEANQKRLRIWCLNSWYYTLRNKPPQKIFFWIILKLSLAIFIFFIIIRRKCFFLQISSMSLIKECKLEFDKAMFLSIFLLIMFAYFYISTWNMCIYLHKSCIQIIRLNCKENTF